MASTQIIEYVNKMANLFNSSPNYSGEVEVIFGHPLLRLYQIIKERHGVNRLLILTYTDFMECYSSAVLNVSPVITTDLTASGCTFLTKTINDGDDKLSQEQITVCLTAIYNAVYPNYNHCFMDEGSSLDTTDGPWVMHTSEFVTLCFIKAMLARMSKHKLHQSTLKYGHSSKYCHTILELCDEFRVDDDDDNEMVQHLVYNILEPMIAQIALDDAQQFIINEYSRYNEIHAKLTRSPDWKLHALFVDINKAHTRYQNKGLSALFEVSAELSEDDHDCDSTTTSSTTRYTFITTKNEVDYMMRSILSRLVPTHKDVSRSIYQIAKYAIACIQDSVC